MSVDPTHDPQNDADRAKEKRLRVEYGLDNPPASPISTAAAVGAEFAGTVIVMVALGWWLDRYFGSSPWFLLGLVLVGMAGGVYRMIRKVLAAGEKG
jgi:ATP synthase protein I